MSAKDRQKQDHQRAENPRTQKAEPRHQARAESNLTDKEPGAERGPR